MADDNLLHSASPKCLILDHRRRFASDEDRRFSQSTAEAFAAAQWEVIWAVDWDDEISCEPHISVRHVFGPWHLGGLEQPPCQPHKALTVEPIGAPSGHFGDGQGRSWLARLWLPILPQFIGPAARLGRWAALQMYRSLLSLFEHPITIAAYRLARGVRNLVVGSYGHLEQQASSAKKQNDVWPSEIIQLIRDLGPQDVVIIPSGELTHLEALFQLFPSLAVEQPVKTTLHVRFLQSKRLATPSLGIDFQMLPARLRSGSPIANIFLHAKDKTEASRLQSALGLSVHTLGELFSRGPTPELVARFAPSHNTTGARLPTTVAPAVSIKAFGPVCLLISALWGRVGSATIFDAQTRFLLERGFIVVRVFVDHYPRAGRAGHKRIETLLREELQHLRPHLCFVAKRDRAIPTLVRMNGSPQFWAASPLLRTITLLAGSRCNQQRELNWCGKIAKITIVNHLAHVEFARQLTNAPIVLETHDIFTTLLAEHGIPSFVPTGPDSVDLRLKEESDLWRSVDACVNLSAEDHVTVSKYAKHAFLIRPYAEIPARLERSWPQTCAANKLISIFKDVDQFDIILIGSQHEGNASSIRWFLNEVVSRHRLLKQARILLVGRVVKNLRLELKREGLYVVDHADRLDDFIQRSTVFVIPDQGGTGISIKAIDVLARHHVFAATVRGMRGIEFGDTGFRGCSGADSLARDISILLCSADARSDRRAIARKLYDINFSREVYAQEWDKVLASVMRQHHPQVDGEPEEAFKESSASVGKEVPAAHTKNMPTEI